MTDNNVGVHDSGSMVARDTAQVSWTTRLAAHDADEAVSPLSNPDSATGTAVLERPQAEEKLKGTDDGDADRFAHYVSKRRMEQSRLTGRPVVALCGKIWVPKHDPSQYPVCPECKRIYEQMMGGAGNGDE